MHDAAHRIVAKTNVVFQMMLPNEALTDLARKHTWPVHTQIACGEVVDVLRHATVAIASTGTVTMECAWFGVPTIAMYVASALTYQVGRRIITVPHLAMPNLLAGEAVFPELVQRAATGENIAAAALALLNDPQRRRDIQKKLRGVVSSLGPAGAAQRAARAIADLLI
jgi:lipid-A-disaccharide synthase